LKKTELSFTVASYNLLATAYIHYGLYRRTPKLVLDPAWRIPALVQHVSGLGADLICLQEVEANTLAALRTRLTVLGYSAEYARKAGGNPDGCATFYRTDSFELIAKKVIEYSDAAERGVRSGHIALLLVLRVDGRNLGIANTHLRWDPPETPHVASIGRRQALQLLDECRRVAAPMDGWLICGDLNATPDSEIVAIFERAGFQQAHSGLTDAYTCKVNTEVKTIDYLLYSPEFGAEPQKPLQISDRTVMPSPEQPSDHLPIMARFFWKS
jgi:mRNA deadenylase 3'-5' endonuclease subunit Ccr4